MRGFVLSVETERAERSRVHGYKAKAAAANARGFVVAAEMKRM